MPPLTEQPVSGLRTRETGLPGVRLIELPQHLDQRGSFVKTFQRSTFETLGLCEPYVEQFFTTSRRGVVRGLHFQVPPHALAKLVVCVVGEAWDVVVDLRAGSPTFKEHITVGLDGNRAVALALPVGCAHGFLARSDHTVLSYWTTAEHAPEADAGIRWDSAGIRWPLTQAPVLSARDERLPTLAEFETPFSFLES